MITNQKTIIIIVPLLSCFVIGFITAWFVLTPETFFNNMRSLEMEGGSKPVIDTNVHRQQEEFHKIENATVADVIYDKVRILCWVMTHPKNHDKKAKHVKATWGKRCHKLLFMSTAKDDSLPTVVLPVEEGHKNLWGKTKEAFKHIYRNHLEDADWFLKADDDTYVVLENLRFMLLAYSTNDPIYFGCRFRRFVKQGYMSGGAGYVLSKEALKRFIEVGLVNSSKCNVKENTVPEDLQMGKCMEALNVTPADTRDSLQRQRFFPFTPESFLFNETKAGKWFWNYNYYKSGRGMDCCSDNGISFHYISPGQMYTMEYFLYHLRPYGIAHNFKMPSQLQEP